MNTGGQLGGALTASLTPWIAARFGWTASFMVAASLCTLGALAWFIVDPSRMLLSGDDVAPRQNKSATPLSY
jgi:ACS family glucarate transporter-like MFS transporter